MNANLIAPRLFGTGLAPAGAGEQEECARGLTRHQQDREAVISLGANRLERRCANALLAGEQLIEAANALDIRIVTLSVEDAAIADDIVDDNEAAKP